MLLSSKDPSESVTVTFDFSALTTSVTNPVVTVTSIGRIGDPSPQAILEQAATISGAKVLQQVYGGLSGCVYSIKCVAMAADGVSEYALAGQLPVNSL